MTSLKHCSYVFLLVVATYGLPVKRFIEREQDYFRKDSEDLIGFYSKLSDEKYINLMEQKLEKEKCSNKSDLYNEGVNSNALYTDEESSYATNILVRDKRNLDDVTINELPTVHRHIGESTSSPVTTESHIEVLYKDSNIDNNFSFKETYFEIDLPNDVEIFEISIHENDTKSNGQTDDADENEEGNVDIDDNSDNKNDIENNIGNDNNDSNDSKSDNNDSVNDNDNNEEQDEDDEDEEEEPGGLGGLIKMFLAPLSTPNGGIDLDTIISLIGGLSTDNEDGTFDFSGLTGVVGSLSGPEADGSGGSDIGSFLGGLLGATIKGISGDLGARGAGAFLANLVKGILPGLSAPGEHAGVEHKGGDEHKDDGGSDSGGFLGSFLPTLIGVASSSSSGESDNNNGSGFWTIFGQILKIKMAIIRSIIAIISSLSSSSTH